MKPLGGIDVIADKATFVQFLLGSGALTFGDFTLKSGRKSPYMINTGKFDSGRSLSRLGCFYAHAVHEKMELGIIPQNINIIFGSAYKGIPIAAATSIALAEGFGINIGYAFNRKEAKDHGEGGVFVGKKPAPGDRVIIVDDVMTAGTALRETVDLLRIHAPEAQVAGCVIAVDRMEQGRDSRLSAVDEMQYELGIPIFSIIDIDGIIAVLQQEASAPESPVFHGVKPDPRRDDIPSGICDNKQGSDLNLILPTPEQIAAIESYLKTIRPS